MQDIDGRVPRNQRPQLDPFGNECDKEISTARLIKGGPDLGHSKSIRVGFDHGGTDRGGRVRTAGLGPKKAPVLDDGPKVDREGGGGRMLN
jgi:hypothetical protein